MTPLCKSIRKWCWLPFAGIGACLPVDVRPPPGKATLTVSGDTDLAGGTTTADGWTVTYDRFLLTLGTVTLDREESDGTCTPYSENFYDRILDLLRPEPQTLSTSYALGECTLRFQLIEPSDGAPVVTDVDDDIERSLRAVESDLFVQNRATVLRVSGRATRAGVSLSFDWSFRQSFELEVCEPILFEGGESQTIGVEVRSRRLFHEGLDPAAAEARFDPYALADTDADGEITLEELAQIAVDGSEFDTLAERLYLGLVPRMPWIGGRAPCSTAALMLPEQ